MKRDFCVHIIILIAVLIGGMLWLLSTIYPDIFGWCSLSWALAGIFFVAGVTYTVSAIANKEKNVSLKKLRVYLGVGLLAVSVFCAISALMMPANHIVWPIVAIAVALALVLGYAITGGKRWDEGDNQKEGYKNYYERKAEAEKDKKDDEQ